MVVVPCQTEEWKVLVAMCLEAQTGGIVLLEASPMHQAVQGVRVFA
jgi:hypothetical protein